MKKIYTISEKTILEAAADHYSLNWEEIHPNLDFNLLTPIQVSKLDFIEGIKWQIERQKQSNQEQNMQEYKDFITNFNKKT